MAISWLKNAIWKRFDRVFDRAFENALSFIELHDEGIKPLRIHIEHALRQQQSGICLFMAAATALFHH